ncbi:uncharacterized protein LOC131183433 [Hevea brasiliensis]|uniref:uncharacterized protein LOC131183433 n=1 Tax=Hevea brasiliensis TaxID=3981 RepID=UPI0025F816BC|nr:uncharacterized protein LOC131183433 [Hevea brasiliensis]
MGKKHRDPFPTRKPWRAKEALELVHSDLCYVEVPSNGVNKYFITFIDDFSRKALVYFLKEKSDACEAPRGSLSVRQCETCGRTHGGVCFKATGACFNCGGSGHFAKDCTSPRRSGSFTTSEGSAQVSAPRGSQSAARGRGRGRGPGNTPGSQSTVNQPASSGAPVRVYTMRQREEAETSDVVAVEKNIGKEPEETSRG